MTVYFVTPDWNEAMGRFVGPVALLNRAKELLPELKAIVTFGVTTRKSRRCPVRANRPGKAVRFLVRQSTYPPSRCVHGLGGHPCAVCKALDFLSFCAAGRSSHFRVLVTSRPPDRLA